MVRRLLPFASGSSWRIVTFRSSVTFWNDLRSRDPITCVVINFNRFCPLCARVKACKLPDTDSGCVYPWVRCLVPNLRRATRSFCGRRWDSSTATLILRWTSWLSWLRCCAAPITRTSVGWTTTDLWFKSRFGFRGTEQPRASTACQWMLETGAPLLIEDASQDRRFPPGESRWWAPSHACSYAGVPLISSAQHVVGTMAVLARAAAATSVPELLALLEVLAARQSRGWSFTAAFVRRRLRSARGSAPNVRWPSSAALWPRRWIRFRRW